MKHTIITRVLAIAFFVLVGQSAFGVRVKQETKGRLSDLATSSQIHVQDAEYSSLSDPDKNFFDVAPVGTVKLVLTHDAMEKIPDLSTASVTMNITYYTLVGGTLTPQYINGQKLELKNDLTSYNRNSMIVIPGAYKIDITIVFVATDITNFDVVSSVEVDRYYELDTTLPVISTPNVLNDNDELTFQWDSVPGVEEYDLEWTYVFAKDNLTATLEAIEIEPTIFERNSTRISTKEESYSIPYVYDQGYILYRVRAVGRKKNSVGELVPVMGPWSTVLTSCDNLDCVDDKFDGTLLAHRDSLNWQYTVKYAEEGKSKLSMSYADGSLRTRQAVTRVNTDTTVIVGETIYDHQGRAAINVLPVPSEKKKVDFNPNFNRSAADKTKAYSRNDFDVSKADNPCAALPGPMDSLTSGAAYYYSPENPTRDDGDENAYIPDAASYPFTQVEYTPDNTGKIQAQSGVGRKMQLNPGNKEYATRYFYGTPYQKDLDRLFGSEVGFSRYYKKNLVLDPNGQISVSYLDDNDKVIATSLAGIAPDQMDSLPSQQSSQYFEDLLGKTGAVNDKGGNNKVDLSLEGKSLNLTKKILVTAENDKPEFYYANSGSKMTDVINRVITYSDNTKKTLTDTKCYDCVLDLVVNLTDRCKNEYLHEAATDSIIGQEIIDALIDSAAFFATDRCLSTTPSYVIQKFVAQSEDGSGLKVGEYNFSKVLKVNEKALNDYSDDYIRRNKGLIPLDYFQDYEVTKVDFSGCLECADCETLKDELVKDYEDVDLQYKIQFNPECTICFSDSVSFNNFRDRCKGAECNDSLSILCGAGYDQMIADMSINGQYGKISKSGGVADGKYVENSPSETLCPELFPMSIYNENNQLQKRRVNNLTLIPSYRNPYNPKYPDPWHYYAPDPNVDQPDDGIITMAIVKIPAMKKDDGRYEPEVIDGYIPELINSEYGIYAVEPQFLKNFKDFKANYVNEWAESLVLYHPEYRYYEFCTQNDASNNYDEKIRNTRFGDLDKNLFRSDNINNLIASDPFFQPSILNDGGVDQVANRINLMKKRLAHYTIKEGRWYNVWEAAWMTVHAMDTTKCNEPNNPNLPITIDSQQMWEIFLPMYLSVKSSVVERFQTHYAIQKEGYCGCIGDKNFSIYKDNFYSYRNIRYLAYRSIIGNFICTHIPQWCQYMPIYVIPTLQKELYNEYQPCFFRRSTLFDDYTRRFSNQGSVLKTEFAPEELKICYDSNLYGKVIDCPEDEVAEKEEMEYTLEKTADYYTKLNAQSLKEQCDQCPQAKILEIFLNDMTKRNFLNRDEIDHLECIVPSFVKSLQDSVYLNGGKLSWKKVSITPNSKLEVDITRYETDNFIIGKTNKLELRIPSAENIYTFNDIIHLCCIDYIASPTLCSRTVKGGNFKITATVIINESDTLYDENFPDKTKEIVLEGVSDFNIEYCESDPPCEITPLGSDLVNLFNLIMNQEQGGSFIDSSGTSVTVNDQVSHLLRMNLPLTLPSLISTSSDDEKMNAIAFDFAMQERLREQLDDVIQPTVENTTWYWTGMRTSNGILGLIHPTIGDTANACRFEFLIPSGYTPLSITDVTAIKNYPDSCLLRMRVQGSDTIIKIRGYSSCISIGSCPIPPVTMSNGEREDLSNTGYYVCETSPAAIRLQEFLRGINLANLDDNVYDIQLPFTDSGVTYTVEISLPILGNYPLNAINPTTFNAIEKDESEKGENCYVIRAYTSTGNKVLVYGVVKANKDVNPFVVGTCYPKYNKYCNSTEAAKDLEDKLNIAIFNKKLIEIASNNSFTRTILVEDTTLVPCTITLKTNDQTFSVDDIVSINQLEPIQALTSSFVVPVPYTSGTPIENAIIVDTYTCGGCGSMVSENMLIAKNPTNSENDNNVVCLKFDISNAKQLINQYDKKIYLRLRITSAIEYEEGRHQIVKFQYADNDNWDMNTIVWNITTQNILSLHDFYPFSIYNTMDLIGKEEEIIHFDITEKVKNHVDDILSIFISQTQLENSEELGFASMETTDPPKLVSSDEISIESTHYVESDGMPNYNELSNTSTMETTPSVYSIPFTVFAKLTDDRVVRLYGYSPCVDVADCDNCKEGNEMVYKGDFESTEFIPEQFIPKTTCKVALSSNPYNKYIYNYPTNMTYNSYGIKEIWSQTFSNLNPNKQYVVSFSAAIPNQFETFRSTSIIITPPPTMATRLLVGLRDSHLSNLQPIVLSEGISIINELKDTNTGKYSFANDDGTFEIENHYNNGTGWITYTGIITPKANQTKLVFALPSSSEEVINNIYLDNISLREYDCKQQPSPLCKMPETISLKEDSINECVKNLKDVLKYNAKKKYIAYLDSIRDDFKLRYIKKCLDVTEKLDMKYTDSEHHFTLYYYDQAGNLVRTVPPAGVNLVTSAEDSAKIAQDRLNGTHKFYTRHTMATTYAYNSLNQLRYQSMPDHDNMDIWEVEKGNQLPSSYTVNSIEFISPEIGFLSASDGPYTYIYYTSNAGKTWAKVSLSGINTLNDIAFADANTAFVVGNGGTLIKINIIDKSTTVIPFPTNNILKQVYFSNLMEGVIYDIGGLSWTTSDGGNSWIASNGTLSGKIKQLNDVEHLSLNVAYALSDDGTIYKTTDAGDEWIQQNNIRSINLSTVNTYEGYLYAAGLDGTILKHSIDGNLTWEKLTNNINDNIHDIYLDNESNGCLINASGVLKASADGGKTWASMYSNIVSNFSFASKDTGLVTTNTGTVYSTTDAGKTWIEKTSLLLTDVTDIQMVNDNLYYIAYGTANPNIKRVEGTTISDISGPTLTGSISKIHFMDYTYTQTGTTTIISAKLGVVLTSTGELYTNNFDASSLWDKVVGTYTDMYFPKSDAGFALKSDGTVQKIEFIAPTSTDPKEVVITTLSTKPTASLKEIVADETMLNITVVGDNGEIWRTINGGNSWEKETNNILLPKMHAIKAIDANKAFVVGRDGTIIYTNDGGNTWQVHITGTSEDLYGVSENVAVGTNGIALTYDGSVWSITNAPVAGNNNLNAVSQTSLTSWLAAGDAKSVEYSSGVGSFSGVVADGKLLSLRTNNNIYISTGENGNLLLNKNNSEGWVDLGEFIPQKINATQMLSPDLGYAVGDYGSVYKITQSGSVWQPVGTNVDFAGQHLLGVHFTSASPAKGFVVGWNGAYMTIDGGMNWTKVIAGKTNAVHFLNSNYGYIVGDKGIVYETKDGGNTWSSLNTSSLQSLNAVFIADEGCAYTVGNTGAAYRLKVDGSAWEAMINWTYGIPTSNLTAVKFVDCMTGYITDDDGKIYKTVNGGDSWSPEKTGTTGNE